MPRGERTASHARHARHVWRTAAHTHSHGGHADGDVEVPSRARILLLGALFAALFATVVGVVWLWPDGDRVDEVADQAGYAAPGVTFPRADVVTVQPPCPAGQREQSDGSACGEVVVSIADGASEGLRGRVSVPPAVLESGLESGDTLRVTLVPPEAGQPLVVGFIGVERTTPVGLLTAIFVAVVLLVARWRGLMALLGLAFALGTISVFMLPALLSGQPALAVGVAGSAAIMFVVLYTTHGFSMRTSAALGGTLLGLALTGVIGSLSVRGTTLSGVGDENAQILGTFATDLSFSGLLTCAIVVAGLGVLNDVTITQASAVWEIRAADPAMHRARVFTSAMRIGRDHIASTIYTMVFAYAGTALTVLLLLSLYDRPLLELLSVEEIGQEVVRTLATGIGLVLAVPITTAIAALTLPPECASGR